MSQLSKDGVLELRERAEGVVARQPPLTLTADAQQALLHELQVHQAELEIQNQQLRETEHDLDRSRLRYAQLFATNPTALVVLSAQGELRELNAAAQSLLAVGGRPPGTLPFASLLAPGSVPVARLLDGSIHEVRLRRSGGAITVQLAAVPLDTEPVGWLLSLVDLSERHAREAAVRASEARYRGLFEATRDGLLVLDDDLRITDANGVAGELSGLAPGTLVGRRLSDFFDGNRLPVALSELERWVRTQSTGSLEVDVALGPERRRATLELTLTPVRQVPLRSSLLVVRDRTEERRLQAESAELRRRVAVHERLESLGRLAASVAEDVLSVLGTMVAAAEAVRVEPRSEADVRAGLRLLLEAAAHGRELAHALFGFSGAHSTSAERVDAVAVVDDVAGLVRGTRLADVEVVVVAPAHPLLVPMAQAELEQALANLCTNALEAMNGAGRLELLVSEVVLAGEPHASDPITPGPFVRIEVVDDGPGMDAVTLAHAFDPFFTTRGARRASGQGLAQVWGAVRSHGGRVSLDSSPGKGTQVRLELPRVAEAALPSVTAPSGKPAPVPKTALVVDDDPLARAALVLLLGALGVEASACMMHAVGDELSRRAPDVVLIDLRSRGGAGSLVADLLERQKTRALVLLHASPADHVPLAFRADSRVRLLAKPFMAEELGSALGVSVPVRARGEAATPPEPRVKP